MANFMSFHFTVWSLRPSFIAQHPLCTIIVNIATVSGFEVSFSGCWGVLLQLNGPELETTIPLHHEQRFRVCGTFPFKHSAQIQIVVLYHRNRQYFPNLISAGNIWYISSRVGVTYKTGFGLDDLIYCVIYNCTFWDYR
jgi:hypothetical protein